MRVDALGGVVRIQPLFNFSVQCQSVVPVQRLKTKGFVIILFSLELRCPMFLPRIERQTNFHFFPSGKCEELSELLETFRFLLTIQPVEISNICSPESLERL